MKHIGVSLAFTVKERKSFIGVLKVHVVKCNKIESLFKQATKIGEEFVGINPNSKYKGIVDVNLVSGPLKEGEILGWESFNNIRTLSSARRFAKSDNKSPNGSSAKKSLNYWGSSLIYFYQDPEESRNNFAFSILTILGASTRTIEKANKLGVEKQMVNKIVKYSNDELFNKNIYYVGAKDFFKLSAKDMKCGNYQSFYKNIKSEKEVQELILKRSELNKVLKQIF